MSPRAAATVGKSEPMSRALKIALTTMVVAGLAGASAGVVVAWSGVYSVAATAGHSQPMEWFLHYVMRRSVKNHAARIVPPDLDDLVLTIRGAAHYRNGCAPCHGSPDDEPSAVERRATPPPPHFPKTLSDWKPRELFWIVKHGVKMTAMPPWPAQTRDDEVWAMVAFLRRLPNLDAASYRRLAFGEVAGRMDVALNDGTGLSALERPAGPSTAECGRCHGSQGEGRGNAFPRLAGLSAEYMARSLKAFRSGERQSGFMQAVASNLTDDQIGQLAAYYAAKPPGGTSAQLRPAESDGGANIARYGTVSGKVAPCLSCHGLDRATRNPAIPPLIHQDRRYLVEQLILFREERRVNRAMNTIASGLTDEQMRAVSDFFAKQ
jgi:cytochrome c553